MTNNIRDILFLKKEKLEFWKTDKLDKEKEHNYVFMSEIKFKIVYKREVGDYASKTGMTSTNTESRWAKIIQKGGRGFSRKEIKLQ